MKLPLANNLPPLNGAIGLLALVAALLASSASTGRADWREEFEGPTVSWREAGGDARYRVDLSQRVAEGAHGGRWCERWRVVATDGSTVYLKHEAPPARVISEFAATVWIKSERPGLQLFVRVVLPRSRDPRNGGPLSTLLPGSGYTQAGVWQQLRVDNLPRSLERQLRVLRAQFGPNVDGREAYVDQIALNVYGGPGITDLLIDDLELQGAVGGAAVALSNDASPAGSFARAASLERSPGAQRGPPGSGGPEISLRGALLTIGGKPFFPRIIQHQGEPLARLQSLGFNGVRLPAPPAAELLAEAARLKMWIVCPPPPTVLAAAAAGPPPRIGPEFDPVLAWDLGVGLAAPDLDRLRRWVKLLRAADNRDRPIACGADTELRDFSRLVDVLLAERPVLGTSLEMGAYAEWLRDRPLLARPGTPLWAGVQTQPLARVRDQANLLVGRSVATDRLQDEQVRQMAFTALAAGARGILFQSATPLDAEDSATKRRAEALELLNLELDLIEPWSASGSFVTSAAAADGQTQAAVIQTERGRLLLPLRVGSEGQLALAASSTPTVSFVVPGVPESNEAWELNPAGLRPLVHKRVAGGLSLTLGPGQIGSLVVLTQDALVIDFLTRRAAELAPRGAALERDLAQRHFQFAQSLEKRLAGLGRSLPELRYSLASAQTALADAEAAAGGQQSQLNSYLASRRAIENLQLVERAYWEKAAILLPNWLASPLATNVNLIPEQYLFVNDLARHRVQPNLLAAGDCEDLNQMARSGWRHFVHPTPNVKSEVLLSTKIVRDGLGSVQLKARPIAKIDGPAPVLETAPVWLTSPPIALQAGALVWIHGWMRMMAPPVGNPDGFLVLETIGGEAMAERLGPTPGWKDVQRARQGRKPLPASKKSPADDWKEFSLYRVAPRAGPLTVTFALCGLGEAWLDDITVQVIERAGPLPAEPAKTAMPSWLRLRK